MLFLMSLCTFLWKYTAYYITDMVNKCVAPKYQTDYTSYMFFSVPSEKGEVEQKMDSFCQQE